MMPFYPKLEKTKPIPERLAEPVIPLSKREGRHWRMIERGLETFRTSAFYQNMKARLEAVETHPYYQNVKARLSAAIEWLKTYGSK